MNISRTKMGGSEDSFLLKVASSDFNGSEINGAVSVVCLGRDVFEAAIAAYPECGWVIKDGPIKRIDISSRVSEKPTVPDLFFESQNDYWLPTAAVPGGC